jgi:LPXTG-site transpeptidase (sortase) family protein
LQKIRQITQTFADSELTFTEIYPKNMHNFWQKIRSSWIYSILFSCFLLAVFFILFYLSNLDILPSNQKLPVSLSVSGDNSNDELKKRIGSSSLASLDYDGWAGQYNLGTGSEKYDGDPDEDSLPNYLEYVHKTNPKKSDTDGDGYSDNAEITNGYDPSFPGDKKMDVELSIEKISVNAPMIWSKSDDEKAMLEDLKNGVAHYPQTASPGQNGNSVISGHSSNYIWVKGNYNYIFKDLNKLEVGDLILAKTIQSNGAVIVYQYRINGKYIDAPDDERVFAETSEPTLTLSTCWPLGTAFQRLVIKAEMVK